MKHAVISRDRPSGFPEGGPKPLIGVLCCNERLRRPVQTVASRFIGPLSHIADAVVMLVPAITDAVDIAQVAGRLDGLLLTGSQSNVSPSRYDSIDDLPSGVLDEERDEVALALAGQMIDIGRPVFGICRGLQEINVLFGGTLRATAGHQVVGEDPDLFDARFAHRHWVTLSDEGWLSEMVGACRLEVNSVHEQGIHNLGVGLTWEAFADDGLIEAVSARPNGADVLAVQWHPELDTAECRASHAFFTLIGGSLRGKTFAGA